MAKSVFYGLMLSFLAGVMCLSNPDVLMAKDHFGFYYGDNLSDDLFKYETLVLDARNFDPADLNKLKDGGVRIITYLSIGETDTLLPGDGNGPGGYASWYFDNNGDGFPDQNSNWGSYYVNANDPKWHDYILDRAIPSFPSAVTGVFLDTVDTVDIFEETQSGMISLINKIALCYPQYFIVQSRGFGILKDTAENIDALVFEDYSTYYDFEKQTYEKWEGENLGYIDELAILLNQIRRSSQFEIWTLDYREANSEDFLSVSLARAVRSGFIPSTTDINITRLDLMNQASIDDETDKGCDGGYDILGAAAEDTLTDITLTIKVRDKIDLQKTNILFLIDTSNKDTIRFKYSDALTADYLVENDILYRYAGDGQTWAWERVEGVSCKNLNGIYNVTISKEAMDIVQNSLMEVAAETQDQGWNRQDSTGILRIVTRINQHWSKENMSDKISPSQDISKIGVTLMDSRMMISIDLEGAIADTNHYGLFMDTDSLEDGYQFYNITASYMILDNNLYGYTGNGESWDWRLIRSIDVNQDENTLSFSIDYDEIDFAGSSAEFMGFSLNSSWNETDKSEALQVMLNLEPAKKRTIPMQALLLLLR